MMRTGFTPAINALVTLILGAVRWSAWRWPD